MADQIKNQIVMVRTCRKSSFGILKYQLKSISKAKMKRTISRRLTAANPHGGGRVSVLRCGLTCCRGALSFHLAAVCLRASVVQLLRFVLQHDSCSSLFVAMTESTFQLIQLLCSFASHMLAEEFNMNLIGVRLQPSSTVNLIGQQR